MKIFLQPYPGVDEEIINAQIEKFNSALSSDEEMTVLLGMGTWTILVVHLREIYGDEVQARRSQTRLGYIESGLKRIACSPFVEEGNAIFVSASCVDGVHSVLPHVMV